MGSMARLYYHVSRGLYQRGDLIAAGNWGRIILGTGPNHPLFYREYLFERMRAAEFPKKPSRMRAAFAFESSASALGWNHGENVPEYAYAVEITEPKAPLHRADMSWLTVIREYRTFEGAEDCARRYWGGDEREPNWAEIITAGPLRVLDRLTTIPDNGMATA